MTSDYRTRIWCPIPPADMTRHFTALSATMVGSLVTCRPMPANTDEDWLVLVRAEDLGSWAHTLESYSWVREGRRGYATDGKFSSWRLEHYNILLTADGLWHDRFLQATELCRALNLQKKKDRVMLFQALLYENFPSEG